MTGAELIAEERRRQIDVEGFDADHDDRYEGHDDLSHAAICYAALVSTAGVRPDAYAPRMTEVGDYDWPDGPAALWPWAYEWWKPSDDPVRNMVKAGALWQAQADLYRRCGDRMPAEVLDGIVAGAARVIDELLAETAEVSR